MFVCFPGSAGLLSFMLESAHTVGAISTSDEDKRALARASMEFNTKDPVFKRLFPEIIEKHEQRQRQAAADAAEGAAQGSASGSSAASAASPNNADAAPQDDARVPAGPDGGHGTRVDSTMLAVVVIVVAVVFTFFTRTPDPLANLT